MNDERMARPVSGEIMSDGPHAAPQRPLAPGRETTGDVIDAEYETLARDGPSAPSAPPPQAGPAQNPARGPARGMDILKQEAAPAPRRGGPAFWVFGLALVAAAFWVSGGHALVSRPPAAPGTAAPAAADPREALRIVGVTSRMERNSQGRSFVLVDGEVVNGGDKAVALPPLAIAVTDGAGRSTRYLLSTGDRRLAPAARFPFSSRLEAPADGVGTVTVDFSSEDI